MNYLFLVLVTVQCFAISTQLQYDGDDAGVRLKRTKREKDFNKKSFTFDEKEAILKRHNELRRMPPSSNMQKMFWDTTLENVAQNWANQCKWQHNTKRKTDQHVYSTVGENMFFTTGIITGRTNKFLSWWYSEIADYTYLNNTCNTWKVCGHYTQVVWHSSIALGCGVRFCSKAAGIRSGNVFIVVCNYGPAGNWKGKQPYSEGTTCSGCPAERSYCDDGLCSLPVCDGMKCENDGKLVSDVCKCDCNGTGYSGTTCQIPPTDVNGTTPHNTDVIGRSGRVLENMYLVTIMTIICMRMSHYISSK